MNTKGIQDYELRHSASHLMASAVKELYPNVKIAIGPAIQDGFYYDFDNLEISDSDLKKIEKKMRQIAEKNLSFEKSESNSAEAKKILKDEPYKSELLKSLKGKITFYKHGDFTDMCEGPHVKTTKEIRHFKLTKLAGAYWKGNSANKMLTRIYGIVFKTEKELKDYLQLIEEAKKRDHVKLGKELNLFSLHPEGPGFPFWHPKGTILFNELKNYLTNQNHKRNYDEIMTPQILNEELWHKSGHYENFKENMYFVDIDNKSYAVKPMNCPGGLLIYKKGLHSYRQLPIKNAEFGLVHRHELSGVLHGLFRARSFTQDDAHVFCTPEQLQTEIEDCIEYIQETYKDFGFKEILTFIATQPEKSIGSKQDWDLATKSLEKSLDTCKLKYKIKEGEGAFYGPKIEFNIKDALGRLWQCGTIQIDFSMPRRFEATYEAKDNSKQTPIMIHRAVVGSLERFTGILIEHYAGKFPLWLSPEQVRVLTVTEKNDKYAKEIFKELKEAGLRVSLDIKPNSISKKVREAQLEKVNYMVTIGDKEQEKNTLAIRTREGKVKFEVKIDDFIKELKQEITKKQ
ncbi:threonine--tRNA ligase [Candidatus Woesearchaeota archaeon]|jgi:threonyl-tRNA synthetase|nr:threonine--tRNA ligase [Candidatus Woesearchaeota archaeon]MBT3438355.1 threonine--tRNA ligase [Candidatus Woesearchaeota archaeon]MBT4058012.1 threonine--tRNA ligase [Candidatus Woesearchaeota archaeon]MBT4207636.1 threonine--tRNA ligase [Candidatus Woesearchaeota archaeon]MBT4730601.1 threonine--tRNA ligase [Candidatus Woesearchaeota archaeon]